MSAASQIAGTDDGAGFSGFRQGRNPVFDAVSAVLYRLNNRLREAQAPKGIVASAHFANRFRPFVQERVPVQLIRIGRLYLIGIPAEPTITSGLRMRRTVAEIVGANLQDVLCVGYSNAYIHYVTTPEEYDEQRYEGGSTLFGRWELPALMQTAAELATAMRDGEPVGAGHRPGPADKTSWLGHPPSDVGEFGRVVIEPQPTYRLGSTVRAAFVSANPNHDLRREGTYLEVQRHEGDEWVRVADDGDWSTTIRWQRTTAGESRAAIAWAIPPDAAPGLYRILQLGSARADSGDLVPFVGTTRQFEVN